MGVSHSILTQIRGRRVSHNRRFCNQISRIEAHSEIFGNRNGRSALTILRFFILQKFAKILIISLFDKLYLIFE